MITRRDLIVAAIASGTTSILVLTPWHEIATHALTRSPGDSAQTSGLGSTFDRMLLDLDGTWPIGRAFVEGESPNPTAEALSERLRERLGKALKGDRTQLESALGEAIRADFAAGRTCEADAWLLSQTECELAGLRWQLLGETPATTPVAALPPSEPAESVGKESEDTANAIVEVSNWGPQSTEQGAKFNEQPDGHSGLWFVAQDVPAWVKVRIDGVEAPTTISEKGFTSGLFGETQERILANPGLYLIELYDPMRDIAQPIGEFEVRPLAERVLLADGTRSTVFCPVENWGPEETTVGVAANVQPDGSQGMWFILPCAPNRVQVLFGDDRLPARRTDRGVTVRVPLALLESPRTVAVKLRDADSGEELVVGQFRILAD